MSQIRTIKRDKDGNDLPPPSALYQAAKRAFPEWFWTQAEDGTVTASMGFGGGLRLRESGAGVEAEVEYGFGVKEKIKRSWGVSTAEAVRSVLDSIIGEAAQSRGIGLMKPKPRTRWPSGPTVPE